MSTISGEESSCRGGTWTSLAACGWTGGGPSTTPSHTSTSGRGSRLHTPSGINNINKLSFLHQVFGRQFSISGCDESVRRYLADSEVHLSDIYNIYTSAYLQYLQYIHICPGPLAGRLSRLHREFLRLWCSGGRHGAAAREGSRGLEPDLNHLSQGVVNSENTFISLYCLGPCCLIKVMWSPSDGP